MLLFRLYPFSPKCSSCSFNLPHTELSRNLYGWLYSILANKALASLPTNYSQIYCFIYNFLHKSPQYLESNLCFLVTLFASFIVFAAPDRDFCLVNSYLLKTTRIENSSCSACSDSIQDTPHLILHSPYADSLRGSLFADFFSIYNLWSRPFRATRFLTLHGLPPCPHLSKGIG